MFKNQIGSAMLQVLGAAALAGGLALLTMKNQETASRLQSKQNYNQDIDQISGLIQSALSRGENCWVSVNRMAPIDGIYLGKPKFSTNYYKQFDTETTKPLFPVNELIGNSGIMISEIHRIFENNSEYLRVTFKAKEGVQTFGSNDLIRKFRITYAFDALGNPNSCYSEAGSDVYRTVKQACTDSGAEWLNEKCNMINAPTCVLTPSPCTRIWEDAGTVKFIKEVGANSAFTPPNVFTPQANYTDIVLNKCCRKAFPLAKHPDGTGPLE